MNDIFNPLSEEETDYLEQFLVTRGGENYIEGKDEGVLVISELDGFLTAVVSGPAMILPSQWLPAVWADFEPKWENEKEFEKIFSLIVRHMNGITGMLIEQPEEFEPIFMAHEAKGKTHTLVDEWCEGYRRGVELLGDAWEAGGTEMEILLTPILAFTEAGDWQGHVAERNGKENIKQSIAPNVRKIHAFWLARRENTAPLHRTEPRVGRNDPCPCGSGKKYKKCCLH